MLKPVSNSQQSQTRTETEKQKQKESTLGQNTVTGQEVSSPLSDFLNEEEMNVIIPDEAPEAELGESSEALVEITEEMEASALNIDEAELVTKIMEGIPDLGIVEEQLDVFSAVSTEESDGDTAVENLIEAVVETLTETPVDTLVKTFVETEDIAKLVSSQSTAWSHIGMKLVEKTIMLLKNGMAYTNLTTPPSELEIPSSLEVVAGSPWTSWRQDEETGAIYLGSMSSSRRAATEKRLTGVEIDITPLSVEDIAGTHTKSQAESWSATQETRWSDVVFHEDGTFEYAITSVRTTGGYDTQWLESFTQSATYVSANRPIVHADGSTENVNGEPNTTMFGSFKLAEDGLSIELTYADGSVESRLIYKNDGYVHFGTSSYTTRQESNEELERIKDLLLDLGKGKVMGADWLTVLAESAAAANKGQSKLNEILHAPRTTPT